MTNIPEPSVTLTEQEARERVQHETVATAEFRRQTTKRLTRKQTDLWLQALDALESKAETGPVSGS